MPKTLASRAMVAAVQVMARGETFAPISLLQPDTRSPGSLGSLTRRETDVLRGICAGKSNKEIAIELDLQEKTVKHYMTNILQKLQVRNRVEAALKARDMGM